VVGEWEGGGRRVRRGVVGESREGGGRREIGHIGYQKIKNVMLISKKQTCLSDKMPPKKVKI
jgi:hypothetical protein